MDVSLNFYEKLVPRARQLLSECSIEVSRAPVFLRDDAFLASVQLRSKQITVNGVALDRTTDPAQSQARWIAHELFHLLCSEDQELALAAGTDEEHLADEFAEVAWPSL